MINSITILSRQLAIKLLSVLAVASCGHLHPSKLPIPKEVVYSMQKKGMSIKDHIALRAFKDSNTLELWKRHNGGRYALLKSYRICAMPKALGPKKAEGDYTTPEGFYAISSLDLNPNSSHHLSLKINYPNAFDLYHSRTGSNIVIHGGCSSAGCLAMNDRQIEEIYAIAREAFVHGQQKIFLQIYPFHMNEQSLQKTQENQNWEFWRELQKGYEYFNTYRIPPKVYSCQGKYIFAEKTDNISSCSLVYSEEY